MEPKDDYRNLPVTLSHIHSLNQKQFSPVDLLTSPKQYLNPQSQQVYYRQPPQSQNQSFTQYQPQIKIKQPIQQHRVVQEVKQSSNTEEMDFWKNRAQQLERQLGSLTNELNQLRNNPDRITYIEDTQKQAELEQKLNQYCQQNERLNIALRDSNNELNNYRQQFQNLQNEYQKGYQYAQEYEKLKQYAAQNDQRYQAEIKSLNDKLSSQNNEYQKMLAQQQQQEKSKEQGYIQQINSLKIEYEQYNKKSQELQDELNQARQRIANLENRNQDLMQREKSATFQLERQVRESQDVRDRLEHEIESRKEENKKLYNANQALQNAFQETSKYYDQDNFSKVQGEEIQQLKKKLKQKNEEIEKYQSNLNYLQNQVVQYQSSDFESKYECARQECERMEQRLKTKQKENEQLRNCISQLELTMSDDNKFVNMENKVSLLTSEIERLHQALERKSNDLQRKQQEIESLKQGGGGSDIIALSNEIEGLSEQLRRKNEEVIQLKQRGGDDQLRVENDRLNNLVRQKIEEIERLRGGSRNNFGDNKIDLLNQEVESWKQQFIVLNRDYHKCQEQLMLAQTEAESNKHKGGNPLKELETNQSSTFGQFVNVDNLSVQSFLGYQSNRHKQNLDRF